MMLSPASQTTRSAWFTFDPNHYAAIPRAPAVYAGYRQGRLIYIGQTSDLRRRFTQYGRRSFDAAKAIIVTSTDARLERERRLIGRIVPEWNKAFTGRYRPQLSTMICQRWLR